MSALRHVRQILSSAIEDHKAGRVDDAHKKYMSVLELDKQNVDALTMLGGIAHARGLNDEALAFFNRATSAAPQHAMALYNKAVITEGMGRKKEAIAAYQECLRAKPDHADAAMNLGVLLHEDGDTAAAISIFRRFTQRLPNDARFHYNLGHCLALIGDAPSAEHSLKAALQRLPTYAVAWLTLANLYAETQRLDLAIQAIGHAIKAEPENAEYYTVLGNLLSQNGQLHEAISVHRKARALCPSHAKYLNNLGAVLLMSGAVTEAKEILSEAIQRDPMCAEYHFNLAQALDESGQPYDAIDALESALCVRQEYGEAYQSLSVIFADIGWQVASRLCQERAKELDPQNPYICFISGAINLAEGNFKVGWAEFESRFAMWSDLRYRQKGVAPRSTPPQIWGGENLTGKTILVWTEQGIGDEVLYSGMLPDLVSMSGKVVFQCSRRMVPIFQRSFPTIDVRASPTPDSNLTELGITADYQSSLVSLGRYLRPSFESFPHRQSYLKYDDERVSELRSRYGAGPLVGISWQSQAPQIGQKKSINLADLAPALKVPGVRFVSLQYGDCAQEVQSVSKELGVEIIHDPSVNPLKDMDTFFAQVAAMDLIISTSNTTAHVAGAIGRPTWVMLRPGATSLWYWFKDRNDSPWYPSVRLFRTSGAPQPQDPFGVCVEEVGEELRGWVRKANR